MSGEYAWAPCRMPTPVGDFPEALQGQTSPNRPAMTKIVDARTPDESGVPSAQLLLCPGVETLLHFSRALLRTFDTSLGCGGAKAVSVEHRLAMLTGVLLGV